MVWGLGIAIGLLIFFPPILPKYSVSLLTQGLIYAIVAMSLDILIGYTGLRSLGHSAFFAIGAYVAAILATKYQVGFAVTLGASFLFALGASAAVGLMALRATGIYFLMITLAVAMSLWGLLYRWVSLTGGDNGIANIPRPAMALFWTLNNPIHFYYFILFFFLLCLVLFFLLIQSAYGKTLVGIRDSELRMKVMGYNVWLHKYLIFAIAGGFAGLGGNLYAYYNGFVGPDLSNLAHCIIFVLMVSLGGPGKLVGALLGAFIITFLEHLVSVYTGRWVMILAGVYVMTSVYAPQGILGLLKKTRQ
jgi:branched-chain amino acid transport system permease protein